MNTEKVHFDNQVRFDNSFPAKTKVEASTLDSAGTDDETNPYKVIAETQT